MDLSVFPRRRYTDAPTPLQPLPRLSEELGARLYIKRDDLLGLTAGGNKTRKLEFLMPTRSSAAPPTSSPPARCNPITAASPCPPRSPRG